jgi:hypothetical protein
MVRPQRLLLLQVASDLTDELVPQRLSKQGPIRCSPSRLIGTRCKIFAMSGQQQSRATFSIDAISRAKMIGPFGHHPAANRIELSIATAGQEVAP